MGGGTGGGTGGSGRKDGPACWLKGVRRCPNVIWIELKFSSSLRAPFPTTTTITTGTIDNRLPADPPVNANGELLLTNEGSWPVKERKQPQCRPD